jgi:hypothetical protein
MVEGSSDHSFVRNLGSSDMKYRNNEVFVQTQYLTRILTGTAIKLLEEQFLIVQAVLEVECSEE